MTLDDLNPDTVTEEEMTPPPIAEDIGHLDIRVGKIVACEVHELDSRLYIETVDIGEENTRKASSELVGTYKIEELVERKVVVLCNASPFHHRAIDRKAMLLCATKEDSFELLDPPATSEVGDYITVEGFPRQPDPPAKHPELVALMSEITPFEHVNSEMKVNTIHQAVFREIPLEVAGKSGVVTSKTLSDCKITFE